SRHRGNPQRRRPVADRRTARLPHDLRERRSGGDREAQRQTGQGQEEGRRSRSAHSLIRLAALVVALVGCHRPRPIVQSCADNLSGTWRADDERKSQFKIADDGKQVVLEPLYPIAGDYGPFKTVLARKGQGLVGTTSTTYTQNGKTCPVTFASR